MNKHQLSRRQFNAFSGAVSLALPAAVGMVKVLSAASVVAADAPQRAVKLRNSGSVPAIGQGSARLGQGRHSETAEEEALRTGISLGLSLIDTSGDYGNGRSEKLIGRAIAGQRDRVFLVSKVEANEVSGDGMARACQASLSRLGTNYLDLYLLHWPVPNSQFSNVVVGFEQLRAAGKIRAWGVSNFSTSQMETLFRIPDGNRCAMPSKVGVELAPLVRCRKTFGARLDRVAADRRSGRRPVDPRKAWKAPSADSRRAGNPHCSRLPRSLPPPDGCAG